MARKLFGTDGIRGVANADLTPELALKIGTALAQVVRKSSSGKKPKVVVGRDTRVSGDLLFCALSSGIMSFGVNVLDVGIVPTPAIAFLTKHLGASAGVVISASHNPVEDNGIKIFGGDGFKLPDEEEERIEKIIFGGEVANRPLGSGIGRTYRIFDATRTYIDALKGAVDLDLGGRLVVVDAAYGAAFESAPTLFEELGARVISLNAEPYGDRINVDCGSTNPEFVAKVVRALGAFCGIAFDGDADRVIFVDEKGRVVDGDKIMLALGISMRKEGKLAKDTIVATVMTNSAMEEKAKEHGIKVVRTKVGDRYVLEEMRKGGYNLGGEQSGHIILLDYATTGDGLLTAVKLLEAVIKENLKLSDIHDLFEPYPQVLVNARVKNKHRFGEVRKELDELKANVVRKLGPNVPVRVSIRPSGTEPVIRIMLEAPVERKALENTANYLAREIKVLLDGE